MRRPRPFELASSSSVLGTLALAFALSAGCSALVQPDPGRLSPTDGDVGRDTGGGSLDTGPEVDGGGPRDTGGVDTGEPIDGGEPDSGPGDSGPGDGGIECTGAGECNDGVACTIDTCAGGACVHTPNDDACPDGQRCNEVTGCVPEVCASDEDCDDGNACNGDETCGGDGADPLTNCAPGDTLICSDGMSCTDDSCAPASGCVFMRRDERCNDGVACTADSCAATAGPTGCQFLPDSTMCNGACTTGATCTATGCVGGGPRDCRDGNVCTVDSCDAAAPGFCVHAPLDMDGDAFPAAMVGGTTCSGGTDCVDSNPAIRPGATEVCGNGVDDNCAGGIDEGCAPPTGEDCTSPIAIVLGAPSPGGVRSGSATGNSSTLRDDYASTCTASGTGGRDAVYYVDLDAGGDVIIDTIGATFDTVLAVGSACDNTGFTAQCNDDMDPGSSAPLVSRIFLHNFPVPSGTTVRLFILVDGFGSASGSYTINVRSTRAGADTCSTGEPLDITGGGTVFGFSAASLIGIPLTGTCQDVFTEGLESESIFRMSIPSDRQINGLVAESVTGAFQPDIYLRDSTCGGTQRACVHGSSSTTTMSAVTFPSGLTRAFFFLDGISSSSAPYSLDYDP